MPRHNEKRPPSLTTRAGKRGRHKAAGSPETRRAERELNLPPWTPAESAAAELADTLEAEWIRLQARRRPPPPRPHWMTPEVYDRLTQLHGRVDR